MLYLLHFDRPYKHAQHYRGFCEDGKLEKRLARHRSGNGAKLIQVIQLAGIGWSLAATFEGDRGDEKNLKRKKISDICPICNPELKK